MEIPSDPAVRLLLPEDDCLAPEISIVVPELNEAVAIGQFVEWCHQGLRAANVKGEILIIDSSTDNTAEIAVAKGARVLKTPRRGLGRAYIDAQPYVRGKFLLLGDCDCTYDFRELKPFVEAYRQGFELVMGSRFRGKIDDGAMPALHRYFGTPVTTWILNQLFSSRFTDIACGMRGLTKDAFLRLRLQSQSWEYASEMVIKSVHLGLRATEVPIHFLKDCAGRVSHHRRAGWFSPWQAGWINLRTMFIHGADYFLYRPGWLLFLLGLLLVLPLSRGPVSVGPLTLSLNWMLFGATLATLGLQCMYMGVIAQALYDPTERVLNHWKKRLEYNRALLGSFAVFFSGLALCLPLVVEYVHGGFRLAASLTPANYLAVVGLLLTIIGFMSFTFTLVLHALAVCRRGTA